MLLRLHRLQRLHLEVMHMEMLPEALVQLDHLTELHLERCNLPGGRPPLSCTRAPASVRGCLSVLLVASVATAANADSDLTSILSLDVAGMM